MIAYLGFVSAKILLRFVQALPLAAVVTLSRGLGRIAWHLDFAHRKLAIRNLRIALGGEGSSSEPTVLREGATLKPQENPVELARKSFVNVVQNAFATAWMAGRKDDEIHSLLDLEGVEEHLRPALAKRRGVVVVMFHLGNWEALARVTSRISGVKFSTIYQPLKNPHFDALLAAWRGRSGVGLINRRHGFAEAVRRLRQGEAVGMLVDQHAGDHGMWVPFFGRLASTSPLPAILARRTGAAIVPLFCERVPSPDPRNGENSDPALKFRWRIRFGAPMASQGRSDGELLTEIHARLEEVILQSPSDWFWLHNRWKTPSPNFLFHSYRRGGYVSPSCRLKPFRVLVRSVNWLGDAVLTIPALKAIRQGRPDCHVTVLTSPKLSTLWRSQPFVDDVAVSVAELRNRPDFEVAVLFPNSFRSAFEAWRLGIPRRFGYAGAWRRFLLTAVCPESYRAAFREHDVKDFCGLVRWMGGKIESEIPRLEMNVPDQVVVARSHTVVIHPGAAHGSAKRWLPERFVELVRRFPDVKWRLVGSAEERERNMRLVCDMGAVVEDCTGRLDLLQLAHVLARADAVVCNDSGPMHLAAAAGGRVLAIFGSTEPLHTGPLGEGHRILRRLTECSPCYRKECPIDLRCMSGLTVDEVEAVLRQMLLQRG